MKRITALGLGLAMACLLSVPAYAVPAEVTAPSAILMEKTTGKVLCQQNATTQYEPASVTKVMTLLLVMEAIDSGNLGWDDMVTASPHAISMGGSQIWLKENEQMTVRDMVKAVTVVSANDCAVALAEHIAGSEDAFVERMNQRARELGMERTTFVNCTGLPAAGHLTCAYDIALMSRELILNHPAIREFTTIWMDSLRDGSFQLSNTNRLVRFYEGCTGLKTGFTASAGYCMSATAERDGMELIAVVMKSATRDTRNETAKSMLDFGFANYTVLDVKPAQALAPVEVLLGEEEFVQPVLSGGGRILVEKAQINSVDTAVTLCANVEAPVAQGQKLGELTVTVDGQVRQVVDIVSDRGVERLTVPGIFKGLLEKVLMAG